MQERRMGRTGLKVSEICLGTMTFAGQCDQATSFQILDVAAERGVTFLDTADAYPIPPDPETAGRTEEVHRPLAGPGRRHAGNRSSWPPSAGSRSVTDPMIRGCHAGISWLPARPASAGCVPIRSISTRPIHPTPRRRSMRPCAPSTTWSGPARSATWAARITRPGSSRWQSRTSEQHGWARYDCVQPRYNVLYREIETELLPMCRDQGVGVIVYNPLAGGFLSGKHSPQAAPQPDTRFSLGASGALYRDRYWHAAQFEAVDRLKTYCEQRGWNLATASVAWVLEHLASRPQSSGPAVPTSLMLPWPQPN